MRRSEAQTWICGGSGRLSPEAEAEIDQFAQYLRDGGARVFGSFDDYRRLATPTPRPPNDDKGGTTDADG